VFVGCNKAIGAVNALRMGSRNPKHDVTLWKQNLSAGSKEQFAGSSCAQFEKHYKVDISGGSPVRDNAQVYCLEEPIPTTFVQLNRTQQHLGWHDSSWTKSPFPINPEH
jgi:hypothetical protein